MIENNPYYKKLMIEGSKFEYSNIRHCGEITEYKNEFEAFYNNYLTIFIEKITDTDGFRPIIIVPIIYEFIVESEKYKNKIKKERNKLEKAIKPQIETPKRKTVKI